MKCPRCVQRIHRAAASCPQCGFSISDADGQFGTTPTRICCLTDSAGMLRRLDRQRVETAMEKFNRRFPQVFIALYTGSLRDVANIRPFSFWLLNRAVYQDAPSSLANDACILLTIDPETKAASMVFGYLLDPYLNEQDTFECLSRAHPYWLEGRYAYGIMKALSHLEVILRKKSQKAGRRTKSRDHTSSLADLSDDLDQGDEPAPPSPEPKPSEEVTA